MAKPSYWELLKHPKWQEKRLRIMELAGFACEECFGKETTLNVHHSYYTKGAAPWEYPDEHLHCLCEDCHEIAEAIRICLNRAIGPLRFKEARILLGAAKALYLHQQETDVSVQAVGIEEMLGIVGVEATHNKYRNEVRVQCLLGHPDYEGEITARILTDSVDRAKGRDQFPWQHLWDDDYVPSPKFWEMRAMEDAACTG